MLGFFDALARGERSLFATLHAPPRHAKTVTMEHAIARLIAIFPWMRVGYASYAAHAAEAANRRILSIALGLGVKVLPNVQSGVAWETPEGGGVRAAGIDGPWTSFGFDLIVIDDPYKNREQAESPAHARKVNDFFTSSAFTRLEVRDGKLGSLLIQHTRWEENDLIGEVQAGVFDDEVPAGWPSLPWEHVVLRAINDDGGGYVAPGRKIGDALWHRIPIEALRLKMGINRHDAESIYQGRPKPRGSQLFGEPAFYSKLPSSGTRAIGLDFGYTVKTSSDPSCAVAGLREVRSHKGQQLPIYYVISVFVDRVKADDFGDRVADVRREVGSCRIGAYVYGPEKGNLDNIRRISKLHVEDLQKPGDKFVRAQEMAAAWNDGRVLLPAPGAHREGIPCRCGERLDGEPVGCPGLIDVSWVDAFVDEYRRFNGKGTGHDDQVDAGVAMHDMLRSGVKMKHNGSGTIDGVSTRSDPFAGGGF